MKKQMTLVVAVVLVAALLAGCGQKTPQQKAEENLNRIFEVAFALPYGVDMERLRQAYDVAWDEAVAKMEEEGSSVLSVFPEYTVKDWMEQEIGTLFGGDSFESFYTRNFVEVPNIYSAWQFENEIIAVPGTASYQQQADDRLGFTLPVEVEHPAIGKQTLTLVGAAQFDEEGLIYSVRMDSDTVHALRALSDDIPFEIWHGGL